MGSRINVSYTLDGGEVIGQGGFGQIHAFESSEDQDFKDVLGTVNNLAVTMNDGKKDDKAQKYVLQHLPSLVFKKFDDASTDSELVYEDISNTIVHESVDLALNQNIDPSLKSLFSKVGISTQDIEFIERYTPLSSEVRQVFSQDKLKHFLIYKRYDGDLISMIDKIPWSDAILRSMLSSVLALLCVLHANGFYHMDIKPENILYKKTDNTFCLADYGLISDSWVKQGTLEYMSPLLNTPDEKGFPGIEMEDGTYITFEKASDVKGSTYKIFGMTRNEFFKMHSHGGGLLGLAGKVVGTMGRVALSTVGTAASMFGRVALSPLALAIRSARSIYRMIRPKNQKLFFSRRFSVHPFMKTRLEPKKQVNSQQPPKELPEDNVPIYEPIEDEFSAFGFTLPKHDLFALGLTLEDILQNIELPIDIIDKYRKIAKRMVYSVENEGLKPFQTAKQVLQELHQISQDMPAVAHHDVETIPMSITSPNSKIKAMETDDVIPSDIKILIQETLDACIDDDQDMTVAIKKFLQVHHAFQRYRGNSTKIEALNVDKEYDKLLSNRKRGEGLDMEVVYEMCLYYELLRMFYKLQRQNAIMEKGFGKLKSKLTNSVLEMLKDEKLNDIDKVMRKYMNESSFQTLLLNLSSEIIKLGSHVIDALQGKSHPNTGLKELFKNSVTVSPESIKREVYKQLDITAIKDAYQKELDKHGVQASLSSLSTRDVFDVGIVQGEQFYVMILLRSFKLEMDYWKRMFALHVALLRCKTLGEECSLDVEEEFLQGQLEKVLVATSKVYDSFIRMFKAEKKKIDITLPLSAQDRIEAKLSKYASHLHMKYANVAAKFLQYASNKKDASGFQSRLCKYLDQLPLEYTNKSLQTVEEYTNYLHKVYKSPIFGINTSKSYVSPYADLKLDMQCNRDKIDRLLATTKLLGGVQDQYHPIREIVNGNVDELRRFIGGLDKDMVEKLDTQLQGDVNITDTVRRFGYDGYEKYIQFVKFYENVSGAVRVFIRLKDNLALATCPSEIAKLENLGCSAAVYTNEKKTEKWAFTAPGSSEDIVILNESEIKLRDEAKNTLVTFGPFFKVIPPYIRVPMIGKYKRVDNTIIADKFVDVDNMSQLLTQDVQNLVLFTYGYSGSGKTYTLFGNIKDMSSHDGIVYSIIDSIQKQVIKNKDNPEEVTIPKVTLKRIHQVYGYITSELTLLEPANLNKSDSKNVELPQGTYHGMLKETLENYMSRADASKENLEDDFIKNTPNNPDSSRGFLIVEFEIATKVKGQDQVNKLCVVDMAGNEHPYDILMKTIPTFNLPLQNQVNDNLLVSHDIRKKDDVVNILTDSLKAVISNTVTTVGNKITNLNYLIKPTGGTADPVKQNFKKVTNEVVSISFPEFTKSYLCRFESYKQYFEPVYKKLEQDFQYLPRLMLYQLVYACNQANIGTPIFRKNISPLLSDYFNTHIKTLKHLGLFKVESVGRKEVPWIVTLDISMRFDPLAISLLLLYYVSLRVLNKETLFEVGLLRQNNETEFQLLFQKSTIVETDALLNATIEKILYSVSKSESDILILQKLKLLKFITTYLMTNPICNPEIKSPPSLNIQEGLITTITAKGNDQGVNLTPPKLNDSILNTLFSDLQVTVRIPDRKESPEIKAKSGYFERIIREGYYINQVNFELIRFFFLRGMSDDVINRNITNDKKMEYDVLTINKYSSMLHIDTQKPVDEKVAATQPWCMTSMLSKLHQILNDGDDAKEENNKYMMICNVRPEPNKFRLGAFQTLELVKTLSST